MYMYKQIISIIISIIVKVNIIFPDTKNIFLSVYRKINTALKGFFFFKKMYFFFTGNGIEEYRIKYNTLLFGIAVLLLFSFSTLRQLQREFKVKI